MVLDEEGRTQVWANFMSYCSSIHDIIPLLKGDLKTIVNEVDDWVDSNVDSISALSESTEQTLSETREQWISDNYNSLDSSLSAIADSLTIQQKQKLAKIDIDLQIPEE